MKASKLAWAGVLILAGASAALAAELTSGIPVGDRVPVYRATKCGGGDDGVKLGKSLCYT